MESESKVMRMVMHWLSMWPDSCGQSSGSRGGCQNIDETREWQLMSDAARGCIDNNLMKTTKKQRFFAKKRENFSWASMAMLVTIFKGTVV
jgi:hypothetical protein